jgi:hypothetical protein
MAHVPECIPDQRRYSPGDLLGIEYDDCGHLAVNLHIQRDIKRFGLPLHDFQGRSQQATKIRRPAPERQRINNREMNKPLE